MLLELRMIIIMHNMNLMFCTALLNNVYAAHRIGLIFCNSIRIKETQVSLFPRLIPLINKIFGSEKV